MKYIFKNITRCNHIEYCGAESAASYIIKKYPDTDAILILDYLWETIHRLQHKTNDYIDKLTNFVRLLKISRPNWKIFLLANVANKNKNDRLALAQFDDILYIDYFAYRTCEEILIHNKSPVMYRWPKHTDKFLFLTGTLSRHNRVRLLYKLIEAGLKDKCNYSLPLESNDAEIIRIHSFLSELSRSDLDNFLQTYSCQLDKTIIIDHDPILYQASIYAQTCFSLVSETSFTSTTSPFVTEKIYKAILNKHPFILAGDTNSLSYLNNLGFVTFEKFLPVRNYDLIDNAENRLDALVTNTKYFVCNIKNNADEIEEMVIHNADNLKKLHKILELDIMSFISKNQLALSRHQLINTSYTIYTMPDSLLVPEQVTKLTIKDKNFYNFYMKVKDKSWPDCVKESDYGNLPDSIKHELCTVFGYVEEN
jgi:hypothetical protein